MEKILKYIKSLLVIYMKIVDDVLHIWQKNFNYKFFEIVINVVLFFNMDILQIFFFFIYSS
jgi:hypothetical protein